MSKPILISIRAYLSVNIRALYKGLLFTNVHVWCELEIIWHKEEGPLLDRFIQCKRIPNWLFSRSGSDTNIENEGRTRKQKSLITLQNESHEVWFILIQCIYYHLFYRLDEKKQSRDITVIFYRYRKERRIHVCSAHIDNILLTV